LAINNIDENNRARERLISQLRTGRLIGCTGAGVSIWAGYQSWEGLIYRLAEEVDRRRPGEVNTQVVLENHRADLLLCARRLGSLLGEPYFTNFIRAEFDRETGPLHEVLLRISALPFRHVLTLNFEHSFENAHALRGVECPSITSCDRRAMARFLRDMDDPAFPKHVVHLHGKYDDPIERIALTETGYVELYSNNDFFKKFVWSMAATRRLFFLGFGFTDPDFTRLLIECARQLDGANLSHFALVGLRDEDNDAPRRTLLNERYLVDPIFYNVTANADGRPNHDEFVGVINAISVALGMPEPAPAPNLPVVPGPAAPVDPDDERRAEELNQRLLRRIDSGGDRV
jgi:hypothetical protein